MSWHTQRLVGFDLETTGTDPEEARIVTASVIWVDVATKAVKPKSWLADPGIEIPTEATAIHGITTEYARRHGERAADVVHAVRSQLRLAWQERIPVVVFNAAYDLTVLDRELDRHDHSGLETVGPVVDPLVIDRALDRYRKGSRKLAHVYRHYGLDLTDDIAHTSEGDALAATRLAWCLGQRYPELGVDLGELHIMQAQWHTAWASNFEQFLRARKVADGVHPDEAVSVVINRAWPLQVRLEESNR